MSNRRIAILLAVSAMSTASVRAQEPASALPERLTLPILLIVYFLQRYLRPGALSGAVKG